VVAPQLELPDIGASTDRNRRYTSIRTIVFIYSKTKGVNLNLYDRSYIYQFMKNVTAINKKPDGRRLRGDRTRRAVLDQAVRIAAVDGLEGLTFGRVAEATGVAKSTLQALFKDRETLQMQTLNAGAEIFAEGIRNRLPEHAGAIGYLRALCDAWFDLVDDGSLPGGCLVTAATAEYRARPGAMQTLISEHRNRWRATLLAAAKAAKKEGALDSNCDPEQLVFEILAFQGAANVSAAGVANTADLRRARRSVRALLERAQCGPVY
jgi:AcrR family transcriptional regulator